MKNIGKVHRTVNQKECDGGSFFPLKKCEDLLRDNPCVVDKVNGEVG